MFSFSKMVMRDSLWFCAKRGRGKNWLELSASTNFGTLPHCAIQTHSAANGPEGDHPLNAVGVAATVGLDAGVVSLFQHKLLPTKAGVLIAHPAAKEKKVLVRDITKKSHFHQLLQEWGEYFWLHTLRTQSSENECSPSHTPWCSGSWQWTPNAYLGSAPGRTQWSGKTGEVSPNVAENIIQTSALIHRPSVLPSKVP